jgi:hypothetical protein
MSDDGIIGPLSWDELRERHGDMDGVCMRCGCWFAGPDEGCPQCDGERGARNVVVPQPPDDDGGSELSLLDLPHAPGEVCMALDCPLCIHLDAEE